MVYINTDLTILDLKLLVLEAGVGLFHILKGDLFGLRFRRKILLMLLLLTLYSILAGVLVLRNLWDLRFGILHLFKSLAR